ncbi:MAG: TIGR02281 family clan AA aspartic protease [Burkholderiales bacterium]
MATGFMARHCSGLWIALAALLAAPIAVPCARAADVTLVGVFGDKAAIVAIDGGAPRTIRVGQKLGAVTVIAVDKDRATVEVDGKRRVLVRGQTYSTSAGAPGRQAAVLAAGPGGHFIVEGQVNGVPVRFLVDTGATSVALPAGDATRLGIDYRKGRRGLSQTAAGPTPVFIVKFDTVRVGDIELQNVEGIVIEQGLSIALLGMSFLNRVEMRRESDTMTLIRRY